MVCENAGRWARIHDIYISVILKPFLGNRIGYKPLPVLRAVCPCSSFVPPPHRSVLPCRCGWKIAFMIKQPIVLTIMRLIVAFLPCRLPCRASRRCPVSSSRPFISSLVSVAYSRPVSLPVISTSWAGRDVSSCVVVLPPHVRRFISFHLVRCRWTS